MNPGSGVRATNGSFIRFCIVGAGGFVIDVGSLFLLVNQLSLGPLTARPISMLLAMTATWLANRRWTFRSTARRRTAEWGRYVAVNGVGGGVNYGAYTLVLLLIPHASLLLAACVGTGAGLAVNYIGSQYFVFGKH